MQGSKQASLLTIIFVLAVSGLLMAGCPADEEKVECGPPIASAGDDIQGVAGQRVILRGSYRLPPEEMVACQKGLETISFQWEQTGGPDVELEGANQSEASFTPTIAGDYSFRGKAIYPDAKKPELAESQWDSVQVQVEPRFCNPPIADPGDPQLLAIEGQAITVSLDGSRSHPDPGCPELELIEYAWSVQSQPTGADVQITAGAQAGSASFEALLPGDYLIQLTVRDSLGADGRTDTSSANLAIQIFERTACEDTLDVTVISALTGDPLAAAEVQVIDSAGASHQATSDAGGLASFSGLATGTRMSITAHTTDTVAALPGSGDANPRPRYQVVSVIDHCSGRITLPLPLTASGRAAGERGVVIAKVTHDQFEWLPHSQRYAGACSGDDDCKIGYHCQTTPIGDTQCTPRSLLPVFGLDDPDISGQFRGAMLIPVLPSDSPARFPTGDILAPPLSADAILPGNMASDDAFLNGLAPGLGIDVWGQACSTVAECPNTTDYTCEQDTSGQSRCKDITPLHNLRLELPAGNAVQLTLLLAVVNVGMENLLPILSSFLTGGSEGAEFDVGGLLGTFRLRTLYACPVTVSVNAGSETDISAALSNLSQDDCWAIPYQQQETVEPIVGIGDETGTCTDDSECGWPDENMRCLEDPQVPGTERCYVPLYRVKIVSQSEVALLPPDTGTDPTAADFDTRVCGQLPATSRVQQLCDSGTGNTMPCDPQIFCDLPTPADPDCGLPYGLAVLTADFPAGHPDYPAGGQMVLGFQFNRSPLSQNLSPTFLAPNIEDMGAHSLSAMQLLFRNIVLLPEGRYQTISGINVTSSTVRSSPSQIILPAYSPWASLSAPADAGLDVAVTVEPVDPLADCSAMVADRSWATAKSLLAPSAGTQDLPGSISIANSPQQGLAALSLGRANRVLDDENKPFSYHDPLWRIYFPNGQTEVQLPTGVSPFAAGNEVWLAVESLDFAVPFDYDLFPAQLVSSSQAGLSSDNWALVAP